MRAQRDGSSRVRPTARRAGRGVTLGGTIRTALAVLVFFVFVFPVYWMVTSSLLPGAVVRASTPRLWPDELTFDNYVTVLTPGTRSIDFLPALRMSLLVTLSVVICALLFAFLGALALSRFQFRSRRSLIVGVLVLQMIPAEAMMISTFQVLDGWNLVNTALGLILVYVAAVLPFTIWTLRGFLNGVPAELEEAAMVDGCSRMGAFRRVTLPLLGPGLAATGVFAFIQAWNEFTYALVLMTRNDQRPLPVWLRAFVQATKETDWAVIMAGSTLVAIPVIVFFLIVQGRITSGLVAGAVKG
ncbi:MAG: carbohydrate ABC transporter permease [Micromonosporaceae bacterium]|jgi:N,N'-diacetylchitobiose transport system permease protein